MKKRKIKLPQPLSWVEIDLKAIERNFKEIKRLCKRQKVKPFGVLGVVKDDAYGHGMVPVAKLLQRLDVNLLAVADIREGIELRRNGITKPILIFKTTLPYQAKQILDYNLIPTVCSLEFAVLLNRLAKKKKKIIDIHIKIDTGMGRLGVWHKDAADFIFDLMELKNLAIKGIYTHFPVADSDKKFTNRQIDQIYQLVKKLDERVLIVPFIHAANSMGLMDYKTNILNLARPGLMLFGLYPSLSLKKKVKLKPAMSVKSTIIFIKEILRGRSISYGRTFIAKEHMTVATVSIGYNDGYLRSFSNKAFCLVNGKRCRVIGRVTMDQIVIDVTDVKNVKLGMTVTILGVEKKSKVSADELAKYANTINYEIVCSLGNRLTRIYKK